MCTVVLRLSPGDVIGRAFQIYREQIGVLLPTALLVFAVDAVVSWVFDEGVLAVVAALVSLVTGIALLALVLKLNRIKVGKVDVTFFEARTSMLDQLRNLLGR